MAGNLPRRMARLEAQVRVGQQVLAFGYADAIREVEVCGTHERMTVAEFARRYPGGRIVKWLAGDLWEALYAMRMLARRLAHLEAGAPRQPEDVGRYVVVEVVEVVDEHARRLPLAERERRIAEGSAAAGPNGMVIVVDCPTCPDYDEEL